MQRQNRHILLFCGNVPWRKIQSTSSTSLFLCTCSSVCRLFVGLLILLFATKDSFIVTQARCHVILDDIYLVDPFGERLRLHSLTVKPRHKIAPYTTHILPMSISFNCTSHSMSMLLQPLKKRIEHNKPNTCIFIPRVTTTSSSLKYNQLTHIICSYHRYNKINQWRERMIGRYRKRMARFVK
jgi:hypothetical protein